MDIKINPTPQLAGELRAVSSKSDAHRVMISAALSTGFDSVNVALNGISEDLIATAECIKKLGGGAEFSDSSLKVYPISKTKRIPELDFGESGSTARFLIPVTAAFYEKALYNGHGRLPKRPFSPLFETMSKNGCAFSSSLLPTAHSGKLKSGVFELDGNISSQFISGLLFALPLLCGDSEIRLRTALESRGYVNMTLTTLNYFGVEVRFEENTYFIKGEQEYIAPARACEAEGDWSNAAFWLAAGAASERGIKVTGLNGASAQGDKAIAALLERFGAKVLRGDDFVSVSRGSMRGIEIDASEIPDLVPVLAVIGAVSEGKTRIRNAARLRLKESDRLKTTAAMLNALGGHVKQQDDGLLITGKPMLSGGVCDGAGDHRIVMAAAIAASFCKSDVTIKGAQAVRKSYPGFFEDYKKLQGQEL